MLFVFVAGAVWIASVRLTVYANIISDRTGMSKALMGSIFLATATQLPEIVTYTTGAIKGNAALVLNNMFGGISMQTAILVVADLFVFRQALTYYAYSSLNLLQGVMFIFVLALLLTASLLGDIELGWQLGLTPVLMATAYITALFLLWRYETNSQWQAIDIPQEEKSEATHRLLSRHKSITSSALGYKSLGISLVIMVCSILLVHLAETLAVQSGLGSSFIGVTLLATATSLPELSTSIAAVRLGAHSMAVSNVFGSNLIMIFLLLSSDLFYREGLLIDAIDPSATLALIVGILLTSVYLIGLILRSRRRILGMGLDSWLVIIIYTASLFAFYQLR
ncbi:MAG: hypothetical protein KUG72_11415 [Pseudomonadales bacterium]|nr:hypothetical protein [Pseudomonadales bacterium]